MNKIKNHFCLRKNYYVCAGIITVLFLTIFACFGAFPFGTKTVATFDMLHQIMPFLNLIFDAFNGNGTLTFSNALGGGANIFGFLCYCVFSPFYLIVLLFGKNNTLYSVNFAFVIQFVATALTFLWFIRKYFNLNSVTQILVSVAYGLNMYALFNHTWFTWLFLSTLMPIFAHNFLNLVKHGKITGLTITIVLMIFNCYGVGMCGQFITFILCSVFVFTVVPKHKQKMCMAKLVLSYGLALALSLFMLGPNALQLTESSRVGSFTDGFVNNDLFNNFITGIGYLVLDAVLLCLCFIFVIKYGRKNKFSQFLLISLVLSVIPFLIDGITLVLTLGGYYGYNTRLSYVLTFVMFMVAIVTIKNLNRTQTVENVKIEKFTQRTIGVWVGVGIAFSLGVSILFFKALSKVLSTGSVPNESIILIVVMTAMFVLALLLGFVNFNKSKISKKFFMSILLVVFGFQYLLNPVLFMGEGFSSTNKINFLTEQNIELEAKNKRLKDYDDKFGSNLHLLTNFSSCSCFASQINEKVVELATTLGYKNGSNFFSSAGGTVLSDSFLGYEYVTSETELNRPYLEFVSKQETEKDVVTYLYKSNLALSGAVVVDNSKQFPNTNNVMENQQLLFEFLGGSGNILTKTSLQELISLNQTTFKDCKLDNNSKTISRLKTDTYGVITINVEPTAFNKIVYISFADNKTSKDENKQFSFNFGKHVENPAVIIPNMFYDMGYVNAGEALSLDICFREDISFDEINVYQLDYALVESLLTTLKQQSPKIELKKSGFKINVNAGVGQKLVVTNANINGNVVTNNGYNVKLSNSPIIEVELVQGLNNVESTFKFPYLKTTIIALFVGIICLIAVIFVNKFLLKHNLTQNILYYMGLGVFALFMAVVYFAPSLVFVVRLCLFKF